jgi:phenylpropionate dioxygenase-like ring-hydroxylating dioxygenase large terminal subunit
VDAVTERRIIADIAGLIERGTTAMADEVLRLPAATYIDPGRHRAERELFFRALPVVVATAAALPDPGDVVTLDIATLPVVVVRGKDGVARTFVNACRHRGNTVVPPGAAGAGSKRRALVCQYHAWTYDLQGRCRTFVDREGFAGLDQEQFGLVELPTEERHGLVWAVPDPAGAIDLDAHLGPYGQELENLGMAGFSLYRQEKLTLPFNWKLGADTFQELFHVAYLHKNTVAAYLLSNVGAHEDFGRHYRHTGVRTTFPAMLTLPEDEQSIFPQSAMVHLIFPNTILIWQLDHVEMWQFFPDGKRDDACRAHISMLVPEVPGSEKAERHWRRNWEVMESSVIAEDYTTMEAIQQNLESGALPDLVLGRNEIALQHFHRQMLEALAEAGLFGQHGEQVPDDRVSRLDVDGHGIR